MKRIFNGYKVFGWKGERVVLTQNDEDAFENGLILKSTRILRNEKKVSYFFGDKFIRDTVGKSKKFSHETIRRIELPSED